MISEITRQNIFDALRVLKINWAGRLDEPDFLARIFDLEQMPSYDSRFRNVAGDIWQHRINNPIDALETQGWMKGIFHPQAIGLSGTALNVCIENFIRRPERWQSG